MAGQTLSERFEAKYMADPNSGCWLWIAGVNACGYGAIGVPGKRGSSLAHRVAYSLFWGEIPEGMCVLHSCDTPSCVNPAHLRIGTHQDNMVDRQVRGRHDCGIGDRNSGAKLTPEIIQDIRKREMSNLEYATNYGITHGHVNKIWRGDVWAAK